MPVTLDMTAPDFEAAFKDLLGSKREVSVDVGETVAEILRKVQQEGDEALLAYTEKFDRLSLTAETMALPQERAQEAYETCEPSLREALDLAAERIEAYHVRQMPEDLKYTDDVGVELGWRWRGVGAAGLYVPGGTAAYPSSVLMNAIPARVAGVKRLVMTVPTPDDKVNDLVLAAAHRAGVDEIYRVGGAQAVGALAYGTKTIAPVDVIVGPGNAYVAAAKRQVYGLVGIDMIAGPSEILVICDGENNPDWIAVDLLSQAEHDPSAQSILVTDDASFAEAVSQAIEAQLKTLPREAIARSSWEDFGAIILVPDLESAVPLVDRLAPEHLEISCQGAEALADKISNAGAIFVGGYTPEAVGDYISGANHVLPTARSARFASGLSVFDFLKRSSITKCSAESLRAIGPAAMKLAEAEGLHAHSRSIGQRLNLDAE